jgi:molybdate transport system substrate-binding protein
MTSEIRIVSSMATRRVLAELASRVESTLALRVSLESVGGVDAARRVRAGEVFDAIVLAADVIDELIAAGRIVAGSRVDIAKSAVAVAVRAGARRPDLRSPEHVKDALLSARSVGYSTGPSGAYLARLFGDWGIADVLKGRVIVAPAGVPVGSLVACGEVELGFQQLSEFIGVDGIDVVGLLPASIQSITTFSGGISQTSTQPDAVRAALEFMAGPDATATKQRYGMEPA